MRRPIDALRCLSLSPTPPAPHRPVLPLEAAQRGAMAARGRENANEDGDTARVRNGEAGVVV